MYVPNFRRSVLYQRSVELYEEVTRITKEREGCLFETEGKDLCKRVIHITTKIVSALTQQNLKIKYKRLNEAKDELEKFRHQVKDSARLKMINEADYEIVQHYSLQIKKLLNYSFRKSQGEI